MEKETICAYITFGSREINTVNTIFNIGPDCYLFIYLFICLITLFIIDYLFYEQFQVIDINPVHGLYRRLIAFGLV